MPEEKNTVEKITTEKTTTPEIESINSTSEPLDPSPSKSDVDASNTKTENSSTKSCHKKSEFVEDIPLKHFFHSRKEDMNFMRDKWILSKINDNDLMEYLRLEQRRNELLQQSKDIREKRIMTAFLLTASLAAIVAIVYLLNDNPTILVNILYICGLLAGFWLWKNPTEK